MVRLLAVRSDTKSNVKLGGFRSQLQASYVSSHVIQRNSLPVDGNIYISKVGDHSRGWPEGSLFDSLLHQGVGEGATPFPGLLHFTLDPYLIMLSVKQGGIKYHFLSLWYDSTSDWTQLSRAIGEHSNR